MRVGMNAALILLCIIFLHHIRVNIVALIMPIRCIYTYQQYISVLTPPNTYAHTHERMHARTHTHTHTLFDNINEYNNQSTC